jgi:hypothetical protein
LAREVSSRPLTAEAHVRALVSTCGICGGQSGTETGLSPSSSVFTVIIIPLWLSILMHHVGMNNRLVSGNERRRVVNTPASNSEGHGLESRNWRPVIQIEVFRGFSQSLQANAG